jgi:hypothetical protein
LGCFLHILKLGDRDGCVRDVGGDFCSPGEAFRESWSVVVVYIAAGDRGLLPQKLNRALNISAGALAVDLGG